MKEATETALHDIKSTQNILINDVATLSRKTEHCHEVLGKKVQTNLEVMGRNIQNMYENKVPVFSKVYRSMSGFIFLRAHFLIKIRISKKNDENFENLNLA